MNDQGDDPEWFDQKFVFDVPESALVSPRNYKLRVHMMNKNAIGMDQSMGLADVQFSCLKSGELVEGWVPLRPKKSSIQSKRQWLQVIGCVRLRLQWVKDEGALVNHFLHNIER